MGQLLTWEEEQLSGEAEMVEVRERIKTGLHLNS
jgi:hypothetical protein